MSNKSLRNSVKAAVIKRLICVVLVSSLFAIKGVAATVDEAIDRPATRSVLGAHSALLDADLVGQDIIAVGERGFILRSNDGAHSWQQIKSPVSVTFTGVQFFDEQVGYIIGHGGTVLRTVNGGQDWELRLNGRMLGGILLRQAKQDQDEEALRRAQYLLEDGPDKPFLDLLVMDAEHLVVVGAYGLALESVDGGATWLPWMSRLPNDFGSHLYSIQKQGDQILIAGERGFVALSHDKGLSFDLIETPYEGSFFTAQFLADGQIFLAGLRGNSFLSQDDGESWVQLSNPISANITASTLLANGQLVMVNQAGFIMEASSDHLAPLPIPPLPPLTEILEIAGDKLLALSMSGPFTVDLPAVARTADSAVYGAVDRGNSK
jgi:photosystem II stability/assembly factor-like uncharacterized protein